MTTEEDYKSGYTKKFRAPNVQNYDNFNNSNLKHSLWDFITVTSLNPFNFEIIDSYGWSIYEFEGSGVYFSDFLVFDTGTFNTYW